MNSVARASAARRTSGKAFVVYEMRRQVFPTAPSPTITHLTFCIIDMAAAEAAHANGSHLAGWGGRTMMSTQGRKDHEKERVSVRWAMRS